MQTDSSLVETPRSRFRVLVRELAVSGLAGLVAGFVFAGVGGRIVMRLTSLVAPTEAIGRRTENGFTIGTVTLDGTVGLLLFIGLGSGILGAFLLAMLWPWVSGWGRWRAVGVGVFALALASTEAVDPHNRDFSVLRNQLFAVLLFWSLFIGWAFAAVWLRGVFDRRLPTGSRRSNITYGIVAAFGLATAELLWKPCSQNSSTSQPRFVSPRWFWVSRRWQCGSCEYGRARHQRRTYGWLRRHGGRAGRRPYHRHRRCNRNRFLT